MFRMMESRGIVICQFYCSLLEKFRSEIQLDFFLHAKLVNYIRTS